MKTLLGLTASALLATACFMSEVQAGEGTTAPTLPLQADSAWIEAIPLCELRGFYLGCERRGLSGSLALADVPACSLAYEVPRQKAFFGDPGQMHAWMRRTITRPPDLVSTRGGDPFCNDDPA